MGVVTNGKMKTCIKLLIGIVFLHGNFHYCRGVERIPCSRDCFKYGRCLYSGIECSKHYHLWFMKMVSAELQQIANSLVSIADLVSKAGFNSILGYDMESKC